MKKGIKRTKTLSSGKRISYILLQ